MLWVLIFMHGMGGAPLPIRGMLQMDPPSAALDRTAEPEISQLPKVSHFHQASGSRYDATETTMSKSWASTLRLPKSSFP